MALDSLPTEREFIRIADDRDFDLLRILRVWEIRFLRIFTWQTPQITLMSRLKKFIPDFPESLPLERCMWGEFQEQLSVLFGVTSRML